MQKIARSPVLSTVVSHDDSSWYMIPKRPLANIDAKDKNSLIPTLRKPATVMKNSAGADVISRPNKPYY